MIGFGEGWAVPDLQTPAICELIVPGVPKAQGSKTPFAWLMVGGKRLGRTPRTVAEMIGLLRQKRPGDAFAVRTALREGRTKNAAEDFKVWRANINARALIACRGREPSTAAISVSIGLHMPRPKSHYGTGRNAGKLKPSAPTYVLTKPDIDKLTRTVLDALTGRAFVDDSQVVRLSVAKVYAPGADSGAYILVQELH